jgi:hypothetical protein
MVHQIRALKSWKETVMHKHLANPTIVQGKSRDLGSWYSALNDWREARAIRKRARQGEELVSELPPYVLYNIGESACRPWCSSSDTVDNNFS